MTVYRKVVKMVDLKGETVREFDSVTDAAYQLGVACYTMSKWIKSKKMLQNGCFLEFRDGNPAEVRDVAHKVVTDRLKLKRSNRKTKPRKVEDITLEKAEQLEANSVKNNIFLERVHYELKYGRVGTTVCRKKDKGAWAMVGTYGCKCCLYFRGRVKEEGFVLCALKSGVLKHEKKDV